jgi:dipeptidyl aminopeptidase/acylaminoacyl peptidase
MRFVAPIHRTIDLVAAATVLLAAIPAAAAPAAAPHPFTARDLVGMERLSDPQPSPDGRQVVFARRTYDWDANTTTINLWLVTMDGKTLRPLTTAKARDTSPRWSPDGRTIAFLSDRGGSSQVWTIDPAGGEAAPLTRFAVDVDNPQWSPDGKRLAFTAEVYPDCADLKCTADRDAAKAKEPAKGMVFDRLPIRHWDTWEDGKRRHILVLKVPAAGETAGDPVDIMKGADFDSPTMPFGGSEEFAWAPDGRSLAFTAQRATGFAWSTNLDVFIAVVDGSGFRCLSESNPAADSQPAFSPDGRTLAWLAMARPTYEADRRRIVLYDVATGKKRLLTEGWDRSPSSIAWTADGRRLVVTAEEAAREKIFIVDADGGVAGSGDGRVTAIVQEGHNTAAAVGTGGLVVFLRDTLAAPAEVWTARLDGTEAHALTRINADRVAAVQMGSAQDFWFPGAGGDKVHGFIVKPAGFEPGRKYPVAFFVHGGPQGAWMDQFHYRWNMQIFAAAGYAVVAINFHGSTGFGQAFTDAIREDWGGKPYEDLMKGLDYAAANYDFVDGGRVCALGASYGGYMVNWMAGHTDRFRCLVTHDGELDLVSSYYSTEELWFPEWEMGGPPWEARAMYERWTPERWVSNWKTPTLVVHGGRDFRIPETEGFSVFTALQRRGVPSKLLYFPDENHWVLKARNSVLWHQTVLDWLEQWLKKP